MPLNIGELVAPGAAADLLPHTGKAWMEHRTTRWRTITAALVVVALVVVVGTLSADPNPQYPQSTLSPRGDFAHMVDELYRTTLFWAVIVFVLVEGALVFTIFKFRGKPDDPQPKQVHGNTAIEIVWTVIPALVLALIAVPTVKTIFKTYELPKGSDVLQVEVIGHQFWWEFRYPQLGLITAGELHVPVNRPVALKMITRDVVHSFWIPQLAAKRDVFSNRTTALYFTAQEPGNYPGQCAEFCGIQHGRMAFHVVASSAGDFDAYVARMQATGAPPPAPAPADSTAAKPTAAAAGERVSTLAATTGGAGGGHPGGFAALPDEGVHRVPLPQCHQGDGHRPQPRGDRPAPVHRRRLAREHRCEPGPLDHASPAGQEGQPDAGARRDRGRGADTRDLPPPALAATPHRDFRDHGDIRTRPHRLAGDPSREDGIVGLDHHGGPQEDRHPVRGVGLHVLPDRRARGVVDPVAAPPADNNFLSPDMYNQLFTMHGTTMIFLAIMPLSSMFFNYFIPLMIGARDVAFPRLNAFSYWVFLFGGLFLNVSFLFAAAPDGGWFGYANLSSKQYSPGLNMDFWAIGLQILGVASLAAASTSSSRSSTCGRRA